MPEENPDRYAGTLTDPTHPEGVHGYFKSYGGTLQDLFINSQFKPVFMLDDGTRYFTDRRWKFSPDKPEQG